MITVLIRYGFFLATMLRTEARPDALPTHCMAPPVDRVDNRHETGPLSSMSIWSFWSAVNIPNVALDCSAAHQYAEVELLGRCPGLGQWHAIIGREKRNKRYDCSWFGPMRNGFGESRV